MAALFRSNGFEPCFELLLNLLETSIDYSQKLYHDNNYKDSLLRYHHKQNGNFLNMKLFILKVHHIKEKY